MARVDTEHFDPSKPPRTGETNSSGPEPRRATEVFDVPVGKTGTPRRRRSNGPAIGLRHSRLPELSKLLIMAAWMRDSPPPDREVAHAFRNRLRDDVDQLRDKLSRTELGPDDGELCAYLAACAIDNAALNGPYRDAWRENQIAAELFDSGHGGEGFFERVKSVVHAPKGDYSITVIEVALLCLVCGFEGSYAGRESRDRDLSRLKEEILERLQESDREDSSCLHKGNVEPREYVPERGFPVWGTALAAFMLVGLALVFYKFALASQGQIGQATIASLATRIPVYSAAVDSVPAPPPAVPPPPPSWIEPLRAFCQLNQLNCEIEPTGARIILNGPEAFASASSELTTPMSRRLRGLGDILDLSVGSLSISGHSDQRPIRSLRFQNNVELSRARAQSVADLVAIELAQPGRVFIQGMGEAAPSCTADTTECDAENRRVVIELAAGVQ